MSLPYTARLLCLCCASFFLIHAALAAAARLLTPGALRVAAHMQARTAARFLFALRMSPLLLTLVAVFGFCIPSYLWLEPEASGETVGLVCVLLAVLGLAVWACALGRVMIAVHRTTRLLRQCERYGRRINVRGEASPVLLLADRTPVLAAAGIFHPQLLISRSVIHGLSRGEREAALRHERAHCASGDNLKRFLVLLAPDALPFLSTFAGLERAWSKFTEWAADDQATGGDPQRALSLAAALVRVARMGSKPRLSYLSCSLIGEGQELSERVDRLLHPQPKAGRPVRELVPLLTGAGALVASAVALMVLWPGTLAMVHAALEHLVR
ncbi:MAG TPA: M56 family metallopeptidase [Candidatus Binatia bacterium]|nr:M56 family metallopeptidase [Candidatus Binatia bacterium]